MSHAGFLDDFFSLESSILELKEFFISEFVLCLLIGFERLRSMKSTYILYPGTMFPRTLYFLWEDFRKIFQISEEEGNFFSEPFGIDSLYFSIYREIGLPFLVIELYIWLGKGEFPIFVFWLSMDDNRITGLDWLFEKGRMKEDALRRHTVFV